jgi:polysaccharide export outer membrane protein
VDVSRFPGDQSRIPTIYRVNFRDPSGFFASRKFPMRDGDVIYVDNADQVELTKFLLMISSITDTANSGLIAGGSVRIWPVPY